MATTHFRPSLPSPPINRNKIGSTPILPLHPSFQFQRPKLCFLSHFHPRETLASSSPCILPAKRAKGIFTVLALVDQESAVTEEINNEEQKNEKDDVLGLKKEARPCELYVCNLPRSCDIAELAEKFKPFGTVLSVEVSRNPATGESRGCGYITMASVNAARKAIVELDGSDVGGREMRVRFSVDVSSGRRNPEALNSPPTKVLIYESPHKIYIGNLAWTIKPEELRNQFSQFGTVVSARVLYDRKAGKNRAYGFLTFSSAAERDAALSLDGTVKEFCGRILVVKKGVEKTEL